MNNTIEKLLTGIIVASIIASISIGSLTVRGISTNVNDSAFSIPNSSTLDMTWPGNSDQWMEVAPETQGIDPDKIAEMIEFINSSQIDIHSIVIARNGYLLLEEYFWESQIYRNITGGKEYSGGYTTHMQQSTTKSIMAILIGIALQEGFLDNVSQTLYEFYADIWNVNFTHSEQKKGITIEHLLTQNSGLNGGGAGYPPNSKTIIQLDCIDWTLDRVPLKFNPGQNGVFEYSNDGPNLLSGIIENVTGKSTQEFAQEYLFTPLGISEKEYYWWHDDKNVSYGGYGLDCTPKVQAKLGILCLNNGTWDGTQIVEPNFMEDAITQQISAWGMPYGYLWYLMDSPFEAYFTAGAGGQNIYVIPEYNIVVGFTASDDPYYSPMISNYILQFVDPPVDQPPDDPAIPGFSINMIILTIFCTSVVIIISKKKTSNK